MSKQYQEFFDDYGDYHVSAFSYTCGESMSIEKLYQMFKERLKDELSQE